MKNQILIFLILLMNSCTLNPAEEESKPIVDEAYKHFLSKFKDIQLPFTISDDISSEKEHITYENSYKFLNIAWIDEENGIPANEITPVGKFAKNDSIYCLVYRSLSLPVGSGNHATYNMASFGRNGELIDEVKIAEFTSWDGGYTEQTCTIQKDFRIIAEHKFENETENKKGAFDIQITDIGGKFKIESSVQKKEEKISNSEEKTIIEFKELGKYNYPDIIKKDLSGQFAKGFQWTDQLGENYLIATTKSMESIGKDAHEDAMDHYLYVRHYVDIGEKYPKVLWKTTDYQKGCAFDGMLSLKDDAFSITDLDNNGIAETVYMYSNGCISDVSPYPLKLIMHEGEKKMAIRGMIRLDMEGYETESEYEIDEVSFEGQSKMFKDFAKKHWLENEVVSY